MNIQEFSSLVKQKYPDAISTDGRKYSDIPDDQLTRMVVEKNPVYRDQISDYQVLEKPKVQEGTFKAGGVFGQTGADILNSATHGLQMVGQDIGHAIRGKQDQATIQQYATNAQTLTDLANKQTDPTLKQHYAQMAVQSLNAGKQAGLDLKGRTPEQIVGDVLEAGVETAGALSLGLGAVGLAGGGAAATAEQIAAQGTKTLGQKVIQGGIDGAKIGGGFGAAQGVASNMQNEGSVSDVVEGGIKSGLAGAAGGAVIGGAAGGISGAVQGIKNMRSPENIAEKELSKIEEMISPKLTAKETKLAESQGRIVKGKEPGLFTRGKPDVVISDDEVMKNAPIIQKNIPGAAKMDEATLADELKMKASEIAQELKPQLREIPASGKTITKINKDWEELMLKQRQETQFIDNLKGNKNEQKLFERRVKSISSNSTLDDIWEAAKSYDESIPENVKNATELSDSKLQYRKEMWLENRRIFKSAINDAANGLGDISKKAFSDMTAMYDSRENIISKAKVVNKPTSSKAVRALKSPAAKAIGSGLGIGAVAGGVIHTLGGK